jgi:hypothetical protein
MEEIMGKDVVIKRVKSGTGEIAEYGTVVKCNLRGYFYSMENKERTSSPPFEVLQNQTYQVGEGDTIPGLELALRHSRQGEQLTLFCVSRFAYGTTGRNYHKNSEQDKKTSNTYDSESELKSERASLSKIIPIPPNTDLEYEIEVLSHRGERELDPEFAKRHEKELENAPTFEAKGEVLNRLLTVQSMLVRKEAGNRWFSSGDYPRAAKAYSRSTQIAEGYFNSTQGSNEEEKTVEEKVMEKERKKQERIPVADNEIVNIYVNCLNNFAACKLGMKEYHEAKELCTKVLEFSPFNAKALLRAAKASLATDVRKLLSNYLNDPINFLNLFIFSKSFEECQLCLTRLLQLEVLDPQIKSAAQVELAKLRKAEADYKEKSKEIQKRIAEKLFTSKKPAKKDEKEKEKEKDENLITAKHLNRSKSWPFAEHDSAEEEEDDEEDEDDGDEGEIEEVGELEGNKKKSSSTDQKKSEEGKSGKKLSSSSKKKKAAKKANDVTNAFLLLGTSIFVVIFSVFIVLYYRK